MYAMDVHVLLQHHPFYINMVAPIGDATSVCVGWVSRKKCAKCVCSAKIKLKSHVTQLMFIT
jgi:hypothetical protein